MKTISIKLSEQIQNLMKKKKSSLYNLMIAFFIRDKHIRKKKYENYKQNPPPKIIRCVCKIYENLL
jgi:predicted CopG family antitoxin